MTYRKMLLALFAVVCFCVTYLVVGSIVFALHRWLGAFDGPTDSGPGAQVGMISIALAFVSTVAAMVIFARHMRRKSLRPE